MLTVGASRCSIVCVQMELPGCREAAAEEELSFCSGTYISLAAIRDAS